MKTGSVKIGRIWADNPLWLGQPFTHGMAWIDLLLHTEPENTTTMVRGITVEIERGQIALSQQDMARRWQWSRGKVIRYIYNLEKQGQIKINGNNVISLITIIDFERYAG